MEPVSGAEAAARLTGMISPKYQVHGYSIDLTAKQIYSLDPTGQVDFGGTEYSASGRVPVASLRRSREDKYEWWDLSRGAYMLEFNESVALAPNEFAILEPDDRLVRCGAAHGTTFLRGQGERLETLLIVSTMNVNIKQNARVSRIRVFRFEAPPPAAATGGANGKKKATKQKASHGKK
jgi:deoxycytidine triphosphate deaminase